MEFLFLRRLNATRNVCRFLIFCAAAVFVGASAPQTLSYPRTPTQSVMDIYFGHKVADPYRWLENPKDPKVIAWAAAQTRLALQYIQAQPSYLVYKGRIQALSRTSAQRYIIDIRAGRYFYAREVPPQPQSLLMVRNSLSGSERVLFDPQKSAHSGPPPAVAGVWLAPDGSKAAFTTQEGGSEVETLHVVDATTGKLLSDMVAHVGGGTSPTAVTWDGDSQGFLHTRWPLNPDGSYAKSGILLYHHRLGTDPATDPYVFGKGVSPRAEYTLATSLDGSQEAISEADGDGVHISIYVRSRGGTFVRVVSPSDNIGSSGSFGGAFVGDALYVVSSKRDSRAEVIAIAPGHTFATGKVVVPASSLVVEAVTPVGGGFITSDIDGGDGSARFFAPDGTLRGLIPVPKLSTLTSIAADPKGGPIIISYFGYVTPNKWLTYDARNNTLTPTGIANGSPGDFSRITAERVFVPSLDGKVKIPLEIVYAKNVKTDGTAPTVLTAYGAYGIISRPFFDSVTFAWLERGGVLAQAMIRGGGEYGEVWHQAARLKTKAVSSDDLAACAEWLAAHGFGNAQHLGIVGGSAGGYLMGLALTRNPSLYRAVISHVGIYDQLRVELTPNGAFNTPEFGTVKDPAQFAWMFTQSPYHHVAKGQAYPAILLTTGENDPRVDPYNSRKMIARLQANAAARYPLLLIQRSGQGHGIGNSFDQQVEEQIDEDVFFESQLR